MSAGLGASDRVQLVADIRRWAQDLGFADAGIAHLALDQDLAHLRTWIARGHHADMHYMARAPQLRGDPVALRPGTASVISLRFPYWPSAHDAQAVLDDPQLAYVSRYALGRDYHRVLRARLLRLARRIEQAVGPHGHRVFADSAPILEKALARNAGLGWIGKHTLLIRRDQGSWFFLCELFTDLELPADAQPDSADGCGRCQACLRACPTGAIVAPYTLDARRCISYLTIEHHGPIPLELRPLIGNRIFGCDDCQLVCPWNRGAAVNADPDFAPRHGLDAPALLTLWNWDETEWLRRTEGMPLRRLDHARWLRNLAIALGNAPASALIHAALARHREHADPAVREHVAWAMARHAHAVASPS